MKHIMLVVLISFFSMTAMANSRYDNYKGQGVWASDSSAQSIAVTLKGSSLYAKITGSKLPAIRLKTINSELLNEYTEQFVKLQDYTADGNVDIAILKSVGFAGANRCYSVFEYLPSFYSFRAKSSKTICFE